MKISTKNMNNTNMMPSNINVVSGELEDSIADTELLVVMIGVFINLLLGVYTIYSQTNHKIECHKSICCEDFEFSDTSDPV